MLAGSRTPLAKWGGAIGLCRVGGSARALAQELCVPYKTAGRLVTTLRTVLAADPLLTQLAGHGEVDETSCGGPRKGRRGRGAAGKTPVVGLRQRDGHVRSLGIPNGPSRTLRAVIRQPGPRGSVVLPDPYRSSTRVRQDGFRHPRIDHPRRFVRGQTHPQHLEGDGGHVKPQRLARQRQSAPHRLRGYLTAADFTFHTREESDFRFHRSDAP